MGIPHIVALAVCAVAAVGAHRVGRWSSGRRIAWFVAVGLAVSLLFLEAYKAWLWVFAYGEPWRDHLPLHLCRISSFLCVAMLLARSYRLFEVVYFWGIGGSIPAMLTPDLRAAFPSVEFFGFFAGHALVVAAVVFAVGSFGFRPRLRSVGVALMATLGYMLVIGAVNWVLGTNYLYLCSKPEGASVYDYLGPWPWYIVGISAIAVAVCFVCYAPFAMRSSKATGGGSSR
jgi:hypothetical integral membrane protein (TIGR02206 family)